MHLLLYAKKMLVELIKLNKHFAGTRIEGRDQICSGRCLPEITAVLTDTYLQ